MYVYMNRYMHQTIHYIMCPVMHKNRTSSSMSSINHLGSWMNSFTVCTVVETSRSAVKFLRQILLGFPFLYQNCFVLAGGIYPINHHSTFANGGFMNNKLSPSLAIFITIITFIQNHHHLHYSQHILALLLPSDPTTVPRYWITK